MVLVVSILKGETSLTEAARMHRLTVAEVEDWREKFLAGVENALRSLPKDDDAVKDEQIKRLKPKIRDLVLDNDILREALKTYPLDRKTSDASERRCQVSRTGRGGFGWLDSFPHFISGTWRITVYAAVCRVVRWSL